MKKGLLNEILEKLLILNELDKDKLELFNKIIDIEKTPN